MQWLEHGGVGGGEGGVTWAVEANLALLIGCFRAERVVCGDLFLAKKIAVCEEMSL